MDNTQRNALEREFEDKSGRLTEMMMQMSDMQTAWQKYEAATRAGLVKTLYDALAEEEEEVARMQKHVNNAAEEAKKVRLSGEKALADAAEEARKAQQLALDHAIAHRDSARRAYENMLAQQGFDSEAAFKAAYLTKPQFLKLEETIMPFRMEYAQLLARCEEIEALLGDEE